jgi:5-methylcytosine-specific restriction endonuclease McrA
MVNTGEYQMKIACEVCGKEFTSHREKKRKQSRFCSWVCRIKSKDKIIKCPECGIEFRVAIGKDRKFCSQICSNRYNQKPVLGKKSIFTCKWCNKDFEEWTYRHPSFCSSLCRSKYAGRKRGEQLYKPEKKQSRGMEWKAQAALARKRDKYTCQVCGRHGWVDKFLVQVHHIIPYRSFDGDYEKANALSNLVSVCPSCHPKLEAGLVKLKS